MKFLIFFGVVLVGVQSVTYTEVIRQEWETFKTKFNKRYVNPLEERFRMKIFMENSLKIAKHNQLYEQGLVTYDMGMNHFGDLLLHEYIHKVNGYNSTLKPTIKHDLKFDFTPPANVDIPDHVDWRREGAVTPIKNQGECGSCYSFSSNGALEGQVFRKTKKLHSFSEQNLVDCSEVVGNNGCDGGTMETCFLYINLNKGIDSEESYPYEGTVEECRYKESDAVGTDRGYVQLKGKDEEELKVAVATIGPVAVAIDADHDSFQFYKSGIYYEPECSSEKLSHAVLAIGYGTEKDGDYWLIKNSWGEDWGSKGYIKMARNKDNNCGISTECAYPVV